VKVFLCDSGVLGVEEAGGCASVGGAGAGILGDGGIGDKGGGTIIDGGSSGP